MTIEAIYRHGVFEPLQPVDLREDQRVQLSVESLEKDTMEMWLQRAKAVHEAILKETGVLPDSTPDIAEGRLR